jgi:hypothetical protein
MPTLSSFAQLYLYDSANDKERYFLQYRNDISGTNTDSNMQKLDAILQSQNTKITSLEGMPHIITIYPTAQTANNYVVTISDFDGYVTDMIFLIHFPNTITGLSTLKINDEDVKSLMKVEPFGGTVVNLDANDCFINIGYMFQYDGSRLILVGEAYDEVITSGTQPTNQAIGGIWNQITGNGNSVITYRKNDAGQYVTMPPVTQSVYVTMGDGATLEEYKESLTTALNGTVQTTGNQTVGGIKNFTSGVTVPDPVGDTDAATKEYVDSALIGKADDNAVVKLTGDQQIEGIKTFTSIPLSATSPTSASQLANKDYVDTVGNTAVKLTGNQSIDGTKTFSAVPISETAPSASTHITNKTYVDTQDGLRALDADVVKLTGDQTIAGSKTFSSPVIVATPTADTHATNVAWVNSQIAVLSAFLATGSGHNSIYRGKSLGSSVTATQYSSILAGTFDDLYIGDYWTISNVNYRIAAFDYYLRCGDNVDLQTHHVVIVPDTALYSAQMNATNVTDGGYVGSLMYTTNLEQAKTTINTAFPNHVMTHRQFLTNAVTNGRASGGGWVDSSVELMNEIMVYGSAIFSPVSDGTTIPYNYTINKTQLPLFAMRPDLISSRTIYWLRDVVSGANFALVDNGGRATYYDASASIGVRPAFSIS